MTKTNLKSVKQSKDAQIKNIIKAEVAKQQRLPILHNELFSRCMIAADRITQDTKGMFFTIWADPEALPMAYIFQGYHGNSMIVERVEEADLIIENYEKNEKPKVENSKPTVAFLALFKPDEGVMPWLTHAKA